MRKYTIDELMDCRIALLDAIEVGVSPRDRVSIDAELAEIAAALARIRFAQDRGRHVGCIGEPPAPQAGGSEGKGIRF